MEGSDLALELIPGMGEQGHFRLQGRVFVIQYLEQSPGARVQEKPPLLVHQELPEDGGEIGQPAVPQ